MKIIGTEKIGGVVNLPSIGLQVEKGHSYIITDEDYWKRDVQDAKSLGYITIEGKPDKPGPGPGFEPRNPRIPSPQGLSSDETAVKKRYECKNIHSRPIGLKQLAYDVPPNHVFWLTDKDINTAGITQAIQQGVIKILREVSEKTSAGVDVSETSIDVEDVYDESIDSKATPINTGLVDTQEIRLEINEEIPEPTVEQQVQPTLGTMKTEYREGDVIKSDEPAHTDPNVSDPKGVSIVWNPAGGKQVSTINNMKDVEFTGVKKERNEKSSDISLVEEQTTDDITFVDQQQEAERLAEHPILGKKEQ